MGENWDDFDEGQCFALNQNLQRSMGFGRGRDFISNGRAGSSVGGFGSRGGGGRGVRAGYGRGRPSRDDDFDDWDHGERPALQVSNGSRGCGRGSWNQNESQSDHFGRKATVNSMSRDGAVNWFDGGAPREQVPRNSVDARWGGGGGGGGGYRDAGRGGGGEDSNSKTIRVASRYVGRIIGKSYRNLRIF